MSTINPARANGTARVHAAIRAAAADTQVDFDYLLAQARIESGLDPAAKASTSSAAGLFQFTNQTWLETLHRHGDAHGLGWAARGIASEGGKAQIADPAMAGAIMHLRHDPQAASLMAGELANDNAAFLHGALGRPADQTELYLAHFLGAEGAQQFISAHGADPTQSAAALFPQAARANRGVFYTGGTARSVGEVRDLLAAKLERAAGAAPANPGRAPLPEPTPLPPAQPPEPARRGSMAEILHTTFAIGTAADSGAQAHVASAYRTIARFGL